LGVPTVASCAARFQVEFDNEDIDDADRIVLRHVFVQAGGKQCRLRAILALDDISSTGIEVMRTTFFLARVAATFRRRSPPACPSTPKWRRNAPSPFRPKVEENTITSRSSPWRGLRRLGPGVLIKISGSLEVRWPDLVRHQVAAE
jgi:hypothetical protein